MITLAAILGFALLFAVVAVMPLKGEGGGCGGCANAGKCAAADQCELEDGR